MRPREGLTFGEVADLYDRVRPGYPNALFDAVLAAVRDPRRVLEAGAGTGHATTALARRGLAVEAVEPDTRMAAVARDRCDGLPVRIHEARFEDWRGDSGAFDLVVCAQAWHWLDRARAAMVAGAALRRDGALAVWWNRPRAVDGALLTAVREAYRRHAPALASETSLLVMRPAADVPERAPGFGPWSTQSYAWHRAYDARSYAALVSTQGDHRLLPVEQRASLITAVESAIEMHGDRIEYEFRTDLFIARPRDG